MNQKPFDHQPTPYPLNNAIALYTENVSAVQNRDAVVKCHVTSVYAEELPHLHNQLPIVGWPCTGSKSIRSQLFLTICYKLSIQSYVF